MNIQIFGTVKCNDTKKAQRFFKERGIKFQFIDLTQRSLSKGEINSVMSSTGLKMRELINEKSKAYEKQFIQYLRDEDVMEKLLDYGELFKTPIVRNGKQATLGYCPDVWKSWE